MRDVMLVGLVVSLVLAGCTGVPEGRGDRPEPALAAARLELMGPAAIIARLQLPDDAIVADVGAGPGAFTHAFSRAVPRGRVIATELDRRHLSRIERDALAAGERNIVTRLVGAEESGLAEREVDLAFLCQVDHYLRDRRAYLTRLARAMRPGGRIVFVNHVRERAAIEALAIELGWRRLTTWEPAPGFYASAFAPAQAGM